MTGPIDTAYVVLELDADQFDRDVKNKVNSAFDGVERSASDMSEYIDRQFASMVSVIKEEFDQLEVSIRDDFNTIENTSRSTTETIDRQFTEATNDVGRQFDQLENKAQRDLAKIAVESEAATGKIGKGFKGMFAGLALGGGALAIGAGLEQITQYGLKSAASLEQVRISFQSLTGSVAAGNKQFEELQHFAAVTPFTFNDLTTAAQRFDAFSSSVGMAQSQLIPFLTTIGNLVAVTGGGAEQLNSISLAFGQIASRGKLTLDNINQINNAIPGFNSVAAIAKVRGETTAQVMDEISAGTIDATTGIHQLVQGMQEFPGAANAMQKQSQTLLGVWSTFTDTIQQSLSNAFTPVIPLIKDALTQITPVIKTALDTLGPAIGDLLANLLPAIGGLVQGLVPIIVPILKALGDAVKILTPALAPLGDALGRVLAALEPLIPPLAQIIVQLVDALVPVIVQLAPQIADLAPAFADILTALIPLIPPLGQLLVSAVELIAPFIHLIALWDAFASKKFLVPLVNTLAAGIQKLAEAVGAVADFIGGIDWGSVGSAIEGAAKAVGDFFKGVYDTVVNFFKNLPGQILGFLEALPGMLVRAATTALHDFFYAIGFGLGLILKEFIAFPGQVIGIFKLMWDGIVALFTQVIPNVIGFFVKLKNDALLWFAKLWDGGKSKFREGVDNIVAQAKALPGKIVAWVKTIPGKIKDAISDSATWLYDAGKNAIKGFINGAKSMVGAAIDAVKSAFHDIVKGAKDALGISSPSKVFMELGDYSGEGYEKGVKRSAPNAIQATTDMVMPNRASINRAMSGGGGSGGGINLGPGAVIVNVQGNITPQQAYQVGQQIGSGLANTLAGRRSAAVARTV